MRLSWSKKIIAVVCLMCATLGYAQPADTVRVCAYNVLNFGGSSSADSVRSLLFRKTMQAIDADVFVLGEITAAPALPRIHNQALNVFGITDWEYAPFIDGYDTDAGLFYRSSRLQFLEQDTLCTELRNINIYKLRPVGHDSTSNFYLFMMHLKASSGSTNAAQRAREATIVRNYANALPANSYFVYCGDMNLYTSSEAAY
ncbi:MAG: hypothetical protein OEM52_11990, partial [bacterium]|nr:hypothetical protein [bacterium]